MMICRNGVEEIQMARVVRMKTHITKSRVLLRRHEVHCQGLLKICVVVKRLVVSAVCKRSGDRDAS